MKKFAIRMMMAAGALVLVVVSRPLGALAAEDRTSDAIRHSLEASSLTKVEQAQVQSRATEAVHAGIPAEDAELIVSRSVKQGVDAKTINWFLDLSVSAKTGGLPAGPVLDRIEQGLSKGVPAGRIEAASGRLVEKLAEAKPLVNSLMGSGAAAGRDSERDAAITSAARALEQNVDKRDIERIGDSVRSRKGSLMLFSNAVDTAAYFRGRGMSSKNASRLVSGAVERGSSIRNLDAMVKRMDNEMKRGATAEDVASRMEHEGMQNEREMEHEEMQQEMRGNHGGGGAGMGGGMGSPGMGGRGR